MQTLYDKRLALVHTHPIYKHIPNGPKRSLVELCKESWWNCVFIVHSFLFFLAKILLDESGNKVQLQPWEMITVIPSGLEELISGGAEVLQLALNQPRKQLLTDNIGGV